MKLQKVLGELLSINNRNCTLHVFTVTHTYVLANVLNVLLNFTFQFSSSNEFNIEWKFYLYLEMYNLMDVKQTYIYHLHIYVLNLLKRSMLLIYNIISFKNYGPLHDARALILNRCAGMMLALILNMCMGIL